MGCLFFISLIIYLISLAVGSDDPNTSLNLTYSEGNTTFVFEKTCSHLMVVPDGRTEVQSCGGYYTTDGGDPEGWNPQASKKDRHPDLCIEECGVCDPEYDSCFGTKYCPILCDDGKLCDRELGVMQPLHCKDIVCGTNNTCMKFDPIPCSIHERSFHQFMTSVYVCLFIIGGIIYVLQVNFCIPNKSWMADSNPSLWLFFAVVPGGCYAVLSGIFLGVCGTEGGTGWTVATARAFTIGFSAIVLLMYFMMAAESVSSQQGGDDDNSKAANAMSFFVWLMFIIADIMLSAINSKQTLYWVSETDLWPHLLKNKRCGNTETLYYVGWTTIMGFVSFFIICILNSVAADIDVEKASIYGQYVGATSLFFMLINVSFLGACKNNGKTIIYEYGITICVFYGFILALQLYTNMKEKKNKKIRTKKNQQTLDAGDTVTKKIENNTTSSSDIELSEVATGDNAVGVPDTFSGRRSNRCETRTLALLINFLIFFLNGWSGYVVHSQVSALKTKQRN